MAVTVEVESSDESEPVIIDNRRSSSSQCLCPFCGYNYAHNPVGCEHLLCTMEYVESNFAFVEAADHPVVASLYGVDVPKVVAGRFMNYLRSQTRTPGACTWSNSQGVRTTDLLTERRIGGGVVSLKYGCEEEASFHEWTYYLTASPADSIKQFASFVKKQYCAGNEDEVVVPFSRMQLLSGIATLEVADLELDAANEAGHWVMLTGLPDDLPLFFFSVVVPTPDKPTLLINHGASVAGRMALWHSSPSSVSLVPLSRLPSVLLN